MTQAVPNSMSKEVINGVAVTSLAFLASVYLPVIGFFCLLSLPLLIFYYRAKLGRNSGAVIPGVTSVVMVAVFGRATPDMLLVGSLLGLGFVLSELVEKRLTIEEVILYTCGTVFLAGLLGILVYSWMTGISMVPLVSAYIAHNLELSVKMYSDMGLPEERVRLIVESLEAIKYVLIRLLPALCAAGLMIMTWLTFLSARRVLPGKGMFFPDFGQLNRWQAPDFLVWGIIVGCLLLLPSSLVTKTIGGNVVIVLGTIYFFQGIAIVSFYFELKRLPSALRIFLYCLIVIWQLLLIGIICLGFFDTWLDFRRLKRPENETD